MSDEIFDDIFDEMDRETEEIEKIIEKIEKEDKRLKEELRKIQTKKSLLNITKTYPEKLVSKIKMNDEIGRDIIENEKYDIFRKSKDE